MLRHNSPPFTMDLAQRIVLNINIHYEIEVIKNEGNFSPERNCDTSKEEKQEETFSEWMKSVGVHFVVERTTAEGDEMKVDLTFLIFGKEIMVDHGYALFSALSRLNPDFHEANDIGMALVRGNYTGNGKLALKHNSYLRLRLPVEKLPQYMKLAGQNIDLDSYSIRLGVPNTAAIVPSTALYAHLVTTKNGDDPVRFEDEIERQFIALDCKGKLTTGKRRTFSIHGRQVVGYSILASELTADESIRLQENGLGGRRKLGCGFFEPSIGG